jgi:small subunit ribosomal protein S6
MRPYEVVVIFDAGLEEDAIRALVGQATSVITSNGGTTGRVDYWGRRRFAYELHHKAEGYYVLIEASAEPAAIADLDRMLHLADEVIRHKVIRLPDGPTGRGRKPAGKPVPAADQSANGA